MYTSSPALTKLALLPPSSHKENIKTPQNPEIDFNHAIRKIRNLNSNFINNIGIHLPKYSH